MKTLAPLVSACLLLAGCVLGLEPVTAPGEYPTPTLPTPPPTFVLFGVVRGPDGMPLPGARVEIARRVQQKLVREGRTTDATGLFSFSGVQGEVTLSVGRFEYEYYAQGLIVVTDLGLEVRLRKLADLPERLIRLGETVHSITNEPPCDPLHWDAQAPCRRFYFLSPTSGQLVVSVKYSGPEMDATIVAPEDGSYFESSQKASSGEVTLRVAVKAGVGYEIRVNSYYDNQSFDLRAELIPGS